MGRLSGVGDVKMKGVWEAEVRVWKQAWRLAADLGRGGGHERGEPWTTWRWLA